MLRDHVVLAAWGTGLAVLVAVGYLGASDLWRSRLHFPLLALLVIACGLTVAGAWHAGEAVYVHGTAVEPQTSEASLSDTVAGERSLEDRIEYFVPPLQTHMIAAGATVAIALGAIGMSFRASHSRFHATQFDHIAAALGPAHESLSSDSDDSIDSDRRDTVGRVPSARFWLLAVLMGLLTALAGDWVLASMAETWNPQKLWELVSGPAENATYPWLTRRLAHVGGGVSIVVLSLLMAIVARLAPRSRFTLVVLSLLILGAIAAQIWFGVLLTFDTINGPVTRFN
jgi:hypothetical protein